MESVAQGAARPMPLPARARGPVCSWGPNTARQSPETRCMQSAASTRLGLETVELLKGCTVTVPRRWLT